MFSRSSSDMAGVCATEFVGVGGLKKRGRLSSRGVEVLEGLFVMRGEGARRSDHDGVRGRDRAIS
jgi:hypothetical protein